MPLPKPQKLLASFLLFLFIFTSHFLSVALLPTPVFAYPGNSGRCAASDGPDCYQDKFRQRVQEWDSAVYGTEDMNLQSYVHEVYQNLLISILETVAGNVDGIADLMDPDNLQNRITELLGAIQSPNALANVKNVAADYGTIGFLASINSSIYQNPPASTVEYIAYLKNTSLIPSAHAQGATDTNLRNSSSYLRLWQASRDLAYSFYVVIFILTGFAIMFKVKLSPQTVVTLQSALPKLIITLILITFSFALGSFIVDLSNVIGFLIGNLLQAYFGDSIYHGMLVQFFATQSLTNPLTALGPIGGIGSAIISLVNGLTGGYPANVGEFFGRSFIYSLPMLPIIVGVLAVTVPLVAIIALISAVVALGGVTAAGAAFFGIAAIILILILAIIFILWLTLRVFLTLAKAYIFLVINIVSAPLQLMLGAIPGSKGVENWFKNTAAQAAVFPTVFVMFNLSWIFFMNSLGTGWTPNFFAFDWVGPISGFFTNLLLAVALFALTPKAADIIKAMIENKPMPGSGISEAFKAVTPYVPGAATAAEKARQAYANAPEGTPFMRRVGAAVDKGWTTVKSESVDQFRRGTGFGGKR